MVNLTWSSPPGHLCQLGTYGTSDWIPRHVVIPLEELLQAMLCQVLLRTGHASAALGSVVGTELQLTLLWFLPFVRLLWRQVIFRRVPHSRKISRIWMNLFFLHLHVQILHPYHIPYLTHWLWPFSNSQFALVPFARERQHGSWTMDRTRGWCIQTWAPNKNKLHCSRRL